MYQFKSSKEHNYHGDCSYNKQSVDNAMISYEKISYIKIKPNNINCVTHMIFVFRRVRAFINEVLRGKRWLVVFFGCAIKMRLDKCEIIK